VRSPSEPAPSDIPRQPDARGPERDDEEETRETRERRRRRRKKKKKEREEERKKERKKKSKRRKKRGKASIKDAQHAAEGKGREKGAALAYLAMLEQVTHARHEVLLQKRSRLCVVHLMHHKAGTT
jgi:hypothetical protein